MPELTILRVFLILFASSRITNIIQDEDSPFGLLESFRGWIEAKPSSPHSLLFTIQKWFGCLYCGSVVVGIALIPLSYFIFHYFNLEILLDYILLGFISSELMIFKQISLPKYLNQYFIAIKASRPTTLVQQPTKDAKEPSNKG